MTHADLMRSIEALAPQNSYVALLGTQLDQAGGKKHDRFIVALLIRKLVETIEQRDRRITQLENERDQRIDSMAQKSGAVTRMSQRIAELEAHNRGLIDMQQETQQLCWDAEDRAREAESKACPRCDWPGYGESNADEG